jgi:hypothetical protein
MKGIVFFLSLSFFIVDAIAQNNDCYKRLLQRGIEEFDKGNYDQAILKWQTAKDNCPDVTASEKKILNNWITKAVTNQKSSLNDTSTPSRKIKTITQRDNIINTSKVIEKSVEKIVYVDRPVEKVVYVEKPVEKIVYVDRPEPYHQFGKGYGKITLFKSCNCYNLKFWIDGEYIGFTSSIFNPGNPECGNVNAVSKIVLSGKHRIQGQDEEGNNWDFYVTVYEDQCLVKGVRQNK